MKQKLFTLILGCTLFFTKSNANEIFVSPLIKNSFHVTFPGATNVSWTEHEVFTIAQFQLEDEMLFAYYGKNGELIVVAKSIFSNELPKKLLKEFKQKFNSEVVTGLYKMDDGSEIKYFCQTVGADGKKLIYHTTGSKWSIASKQ